MLRIFYKVSEVLLLVLIAWHISGALVWGSWDQEGTGSLGFRPVFMAGCTRLSWVYVVLGMTVMVTWVLKGEAKKKPGEPKGPSAEGKSSQPNN